MLPHSSSERPDAPLPYSINTHEGIPAVIIPVASTPTVGPTPAGLTPRTKSIPAAAARGEASSTPSMMLSVSTSSAGEPSAGVAAGTRQAITENTPHSHAQGTQQHRHAPHVLSHTHHAMRVGRPAGKLGIGAGTPRLEPQPAVSPQQHYTELSEVEVPNERTSLLPRPDTSQLQSQQHQRDATPVTGKRSVHFEEYPSHMLVDRALEAMSSATASSAAAEGAAAAGPKGGDVGSVSSTTTSAWIQSIFLNVSIGIVNTVLTIPCLFGYASIIYAHPTFRPIVPMLAKLILLSSVVHQICFSLLSSMPYAIGQVQDSGLIFLSAIASSICTLIHTKWYPTVVIPGSAAEASTRPPLSPEEAALEHEYTVAATTTTVVALSLATCLLGAAMVMMGRLRLAKLVSYLPMPVISGYLAFIGFFCLGAGFSICTGENINTVGKFKLLWNLTYAIHCLPALVCGIILWRIAKTFKNPVALPAAMVVMPIAFYIVLAITGTSIQEARDAGWVSPLNESASPKDILSLLDFNKIHWSTIPSQAVEWFIMTIVLAFSSCLDVAAIEIDLGRPLDINHELETVGWSNFVSGGLGGYAGSYIFSQTIFTCRTGSRSYLVGWVVAIVELAVFLVPVDVMSYVPRFFFAATLMFIAFDLMYEWLLQMYLQGKVSAREYVVCVATFAAILMYNVQVGLLIGVIIAIINFLWGYVQSSNVTPTLKRSSVSLDPKLERIVEKHLEEIRVLPLSGYIFFGSALSILESAKESMLIEVALPSISPPHNTVVLPLRDFERTQHRSEKDFTEQLLARVRAHKRLMLSKEQNELFKSGRGPEPLDLGAEAKIPNSSGPDARSSPQHGKPGRAMRTVPSIRSLAALANGNGSSNLTNYGSMSARGTLGSKGSFTSLRSGENGIGSRSPSPSMSVDEPVQPVTRTLSDCHHMHPPGSGGATSACHGAGLVDNPKDVSPEDDEAPPTHTLILDFSMVAGVDVTAVRSCFLILSCSAKECGVDIIYSGISPETEMLFRNNHVIPNRLSQDNSSSADLQLPFKYPMAFPPSFPPINAEPGQIFVSPDVDTALQWAEARLLLRKLGTEELTV